MIDIDRLFFAAYEGRLLSPKAIKFINLCIRQLFIKEPNTLSLSGNYIIVGDLHG